MFQALTRSRRSNYHLGQLQRRQLTHAMLSSRSRAQGFAAKQARCM